MTASTRLIIVGAGGFGRSVAEAAGIGSHLESRFTIAGFVDDRGPGFGPVLGHSVLGGIGDLPSLHRTHGDALIAVAIGDNARRRDFHALACAAGFALATVVHSRAFVSALAHLGEGALVMAGAIVGTEAQIGAGAIVNAGAIVDHHARVGDFAHLGVGTCMAGGAELGALAWLREGMVLRTGQVLLAGDAVTPL